MRRTPFLLPAALILLLPAAFGRAYPQERIVQSRQSITVEFNEDDVAQINAELVDGTPVEIIVKNSLITSEAVPYEPNIWGGFWPGWGGHPSQTAQAMTTMKVKVGNRAIDIPMSAYCDLAHAHHILFEDTSIPYRFTHNGVDYVNINRKSFRIIVFGSDAAASYRAQLDFSTQHLERRAVWLSEFNTAVKEVTVYLTEDPIIRE